MFICRGQFLARSLQSCLARPTFVVVSSGLGRRGQSAITRLDVVRSTKLFNASTYRTIQTTAAATPAQTQSTEQTEAQPILQFDDLRKKGLVSHRVTNVITQRMGISEMTDVQRLTINTTLNGVDVLVSLLYCFI